MCTHIQAGRRMNVCIWVASTERCRLRASVPASGQDVRTVTSQRPGYTIKTHFNQFQTPQSQKQPKPWKSHFPIKGNLLTGKFYELFYNSESKTARWPRLGADMKEASDKRDEETTHTHTHTHTRTHTHQLKTGSHTPAAPGTVWLTSVHRGGWTEPLSLYYVLLIHIFRFEF